MDVGSKYIEYRKPSLGQEHCRYVREATLGLSPLGSKCNVDAISGRNGNTYDVDMHIEVQL